MRQVLDLRRAGGALILVAYRGDWRPYCCGQLVRLANEEPDLQRGGAEIVALSVDSPGRNEAFRRRWHLPYRIVSDPGGERFLQPLDAWNPGERGGIGWPTGWLYAPDGTEVFRARSRDFADRPPDDDLLAALGGLALPAIDLAPAPPTAAPEEHDGALRVETFGPFFRGIRFATFALAGRLTDDADRDEALAMSAMAGSFLDAWKQRRAAPSI